jgi:LysR family glycine cleavage system transcriptional activator
MVANEIDSGQLIQLLKTPQIEEFAYYLVCPEHKQAQPKIVAFREWILGPVAQAAHADSASSRRNTFGRGRRSRSA